MSVTYREALVDRDVRPDRCWRKRPSKGETGVQHGHRTRESDLRTNRNHVQILPGSSDDATLIDAPRILCKLAGGRNLDLGRWSGMTFLRIVIPLYLFV